MQKSKCIIYPRIVEEVVDYAELQQVWNCGYLTCYRILSGQSAPNHIRKKQLSDYLGIPVDELWIRVDPNNSVIISESDKEETPRNDHT